MREFYVYILASKRNGTLYVGMTEELRARIRRHKSKAASKFTKNYEVNKLVYFEKCKDKQAASAREMQLKKYNRRWKIRLIEQLNPVWNDLSDEIEAKNPGSSAEDQRRRTEDRGRRTDKNQNDKKRTSRGQPCHKWQG